MRFDNPQLSSEYFCVCFGSQPKTKFGDCPQGYASYTVVPFARTPSFLYILDRNGLSNDYPHGVEGVLKFNDDGTLNVLLAKSEYKMRITLVNAYKEIPQPEEEEEPKTKTPEKKNNATIGLIVGGIVFVLLTLLLVFLIWFFMCRRSNSTNNLCETNPNEALDDSQKPSKKVATSQSTKVIPNSKQTSSSVTKDSNGHNGAQTTVLH